MGALLPAGTPLPSDAVVGVDDDVERRVERELGHEYQRGEAIALFVGSVALVVFVWSDAARDLAGIQDLPLGWLFAIRLLVGTLLAGMGWALWRAEHAPTLTRVFDVAALALVGALVGYIHVLTEGGNPLYFGSIATVAFLRCLYVPSGWRMAALSCGAAWLVGAVAAGVTHAVVGVPDVPFYWIDFGNMQGFVVLNGGLAVGGAAMVHRLRRQEIEARARGRYKLTRRLGAGGFGEVYEAWDNLLERTCAIKMLDPKWGADEEVVQRFELEAKATCRLGNPHTVQVHDYGCTRDQRLYYVMEHLQGEDLARTIRGAGALEARRLLRLMKHAAAALAEAHAKGVIHRDVKPENLFISPDDTGAENLKVLDFGLVAAIGDGDEGKREAPAGTPWYMPPERARGERGDARCDIYSLGAVMFHALTGRPVFNGDSPIAILLKQVNAEPERPSALRDEIPDYLDAIVLRCLQKEPSARFQSMAELIAALDTAQDRILREAPRASW